MSIYHTHGFIDETGGYIIYINHGSVGYTCMVNTVVYFRLHDFQQGVC